MTARAMQRLEWCEVPAGEFRMGSDESGDNPGRVAEVGPYLISRYPVTNAQYAEFVRENPEWMKGAPDEDLVDVDYLGDWTGSTPPAGHEEHPVAWVSWHAAVAFCEWASRVLDRRIVLPTEVMWEKACRGIDGRPYPWGDTIDDTRANYSSHSAPVGRTVDGRMPVGKFSPRGDSPFGCADMAGNVWEWCVDWMDDYEDEKALRGGGWNFTPEFLRGYFRFGCSPSATYNYIGFRCSIALDQ